MSTTTTVISPPPTATSSYHRPVRPLSSFSSRSPKINQFSRSIRINFHPINKRLHHLEEQHSLLAGELRSWRCSAVATIGESEFSGEVLESEVPVLVEFVANWCGPCRLISSIIEWASQEYEDKLKIVKIDHDANPQLIEEYKVYGLPCLILFKNGQEVPESRREGAITKAKLKEYLDSLLVVHM